MIGFQPHIHESYSEISREQPVEPHPKFGPLGVVDVQMDRAPPDGDRAPTLGEVRDVHIARAD